MSGRKCKSDWDRKSENEQKSEAEREYEINKKRDRKNMKFDFCWSYRSLCISSFNSN